MAEYSANAVQAVEPGQTVIFTDSPEPCTRGFIRHRDGSGNFLLSGWVPKRFGCRCNSTGRSAQYMVDFAANIAIPTGGTAGEISLALTIDGSTIPTSLMIVTPADVGEFFNVSRAIDVDVWNGCCESVAVTNTSDQTISVQNANIVFSRPDLNVTY